jgi:hypothetical protein
MRPLVFPAALTCALARHLEHHLLHDTQRHSRSTGYPADISTDLPMRRDVRAQRGHCVLATLQTTTRVVGEYCRRQHAWRSDRMDELRSRGRGIDVSEGLKKGNLGGCLAPLRCS